MDPRARGFPHLSLHLLSERGGFRPGYFLSYFYLPLTASFGADRDGSEFLIDRDGLKEEKDFSPPARFT